MSEQNIIRLTSKMAKEIHNNQSQFQVNGLFAEAHLFELSF